MSRENVEIIRSNLAAYNRRDVGAMLTLWHPEGEWFSAGAGNVEAHVYRGHPSVREYFEDIAETWDQNSISECEYRDLDDDRVLVLGQIHMRGHASGINVDQPIFLVYELRDEMIFRGHSYLDRAEALHAAGLSE
jgi:ketosteroid isomerase-like protein